LEVARSGTEEELGKLEKVKKKKRYRKLVKEK